MSIVSIKSKTSAAKNKNEEKSSSKIFSPNFKSTPTILSRDLKVEGDIVSAGLIEIEGSIKGTIKGNSIILREAGNVDGEFIAESLSIRGKFNGLIKAKNISISSKAVITGTIEYDTLSVEDGACIDGQFKKINSKS